MSIDVHKGLSRPQLINLVLITIFWGVNWPIMKMAVTEYPPMTFRGLSVVIGLIFLALYVKMRGIDFRIPRRDWALIVRLSVLNMVVWHVCLMLALPSLNSGRAAVIGYTMPVFSALWGYVIYKQKITKLHTGCILIAFLGVALLLWEEFSTLSGAPGAALTLLFATACWAIGTQQLRRADTDIHIVTIAFWMTAVTGIAIFVLALAREPSQWHMPSASVNAAILYNGVIVFAFCHTAWAFLARTLSPVASSISISLIPVIGLLSGAYFLNETLNWQDGIAVVLIGSAIIATLIPDKPSLAQ
ncbi:MAG: EamA family transporter [Robiginitomaculum sp.]|nr:MAG: EamA family transporter [Robiginitomaculum sp.]